MISFESCLEIMQGRLFEMSACKNYNSEKFIALFMRSKLAESIDMEYSRMQFMDEAYWMEEIEDAEKSIPTEGIVIDKDELFWMGYIYRQWHNISGESSKQIYRKMNFKRLHKLYGSEYYNDAASIMSLC